MKKTIRCVLAFICCFTLLFGTVPVSAKETNEPVRGDKISARWWTENPNPAPGSEAWLQNHYSKTPPGKKSKECGIKALTGLFTGSLLNTVAQTLEKIPMTPLSFALAYGAEYLISYTMCCFS